jgi:hypothetical protein
MSGTLKSRADIKALLERAHQDYREPEPEDDLDDQILWHSQVQQRTQTWPPTPLQPPSVDVAKKMLREIWPRDSRATHPCRPFWLRVPRTLVRQFQVVTLSEAVGQIIGWGVHQIQSARSMEPLLLIGSTSRFVDPDGDWEVIDYARPK